MTNEELLQQLKFIQNMKCETQTLELKSAEKGCPTRLYDSLSSFSNQDSGGIIVFGVDEAQALQLMTLQSENFKQTLYFSQDLC